MKPSLLQDWITIKSTEANQTVSQSAHQYVDLGHYEDLVFYLDVKQSDGTPSVPTVSYETSCTQQHSMFLPMIAPIAMNVGLRVDRVMFSTASVPPARYVRWNLRYSGTGTWNATFRIWMVAYEYGCARPRVA